LKRMLRESISISYKGEAKWKNLLFYYSQFYL
jgi:hypothetical protein